VVFAKKAMKIAKFKGDFAKWGYLNIFFREHIFGEFQSRSDRLSRLGNA
jgi:hypothetical protein